MQCKAIDYVHRERDRLVKLRQKQVNNFVGAVTAGKCQVLPQLFSKIRQTSGFLTILGEIELQLSPRLSKPRYVISSLFLQDSFKKLTADEDEQFFFVTGAQIDNAHVLDQSAEFQHEKRSAIGVTGDMKSTHRLLIRLDQFGHRLLATFHSHPGLGPNATRPSSTDTAFQTRLEKAGYLALMAIFTRDGFIRFLRQDSIPAIEIYGSGVEKYDGQACIYRLTDLDNSSR